MSMRWGAVAIFVVFLTGCESDPARQMPAGAIATGPTDCPVVISFEGTRLQASRVCEDEEKIVQLPLDSSSVSASIFQSGLKAAYRELKVEPTAQPLLVGIPPETTPAQVDALLDLALRELKVPYFLFQLNEGFTGMLAAPVFFLTKGTSAYTIVQFSRGASADGHGAGGQSRCALGRGAR